MSINNATPSEWDAASAAAGWGQPAPTASTEPACWDLVVQDMQRRDNFGKAKYGVRLQPNNGRDFLRDAYEEALDLAVYLRGLIYEQEQHNAK